MLNTVIEVLACILVTLLGALAGRAHGGGTVAGWPAWGRIVSVIYLSALMGLANWMLFGFYAVAALATALTAFAFSTGHGRFFAMQGADLTDPNPEVLEKLFGWLYWGDIAKPAYSWFMMGIKGFLIGAAVLPFGIVLAGALPTLYSWSFKTYKDSKPAEWFSGSVIAALAAGVILWGTHE